MLNGGYKSMPLLDTVVGPASDRDRMVFNILAVLGLVLMAMTLAPALLDTLHVHRSKSWCGQIVAWMVYSGGFLILYGRQDGPDPPFGICVFQAAMIYAAPVMLSSALFSSKLSLMKRVLPLVIPSAFFAYVFVEVLLVKSCIEYRANFILIIGSQLIQDPTAVQREESHLIILFVVHEYTSATFNWALTLPARYPKYLAILAQAETETSR
ncbi:hypothetical protein BD779DRAFT_1466301 [Infundibulicybe gibba]|nr:hypothetical protein BD779DRAFT_1466301 [Infundibulicybe gibba]